MGENARVATCEMARSDGGQSTGPHRGELRSVDDRRRCTALRVVERDEPELGRQPATIVVDEVADDLYPGNAERCDICPQDVPVAGELRPRHEMHARLEHDF